MNRRSFLAAAAMALPSPHVFANERTIGWISPESRETTAPFFNAFKTGLMNAGGASVRIAERYVVGGADAVAQQVRELERLGVSLIVSQGAATVAVMAAKPTVPVVFGFSGDPIVAGFAESLARPHRNATGVSFMSLELNPKRIDLLRIAMPSARKVALLSNARHPGEENEIVVCQRAVGEVGIELTVHRTQGATDMSKVVTEALDGGAQALVMLPSSTMVQAAPVVVAQCLVRKVPVVSGWASIARAGALLTYGPNLQEAYKRVAFYAVRVLGGVAPASLPIEQPTILELVLNRKAAAALGLILPATLLAQADEIIE